MICLHIQMIGVMNQEQDDDKDQEVDGGTNDLGGGDGGG